MCGSDEPSTDSVRTQTDCGYCTTFLLFLFNCVRLITTATTLVVLVGELLLSNPRRLLLIRTNWRCMLTQKTNVLFAFWSVG